MLVLVYGKPLTGKRVIGDPKLFSLEERIFNTVCVIAFMAMCFEVPFNFAIGLIGPANLCVFGLFFAAYLYYLSRIKRKSSLGIKYFCFVCNLIFAANYFVNSGIYGPNLLLFSLGFLLIMAIIPKSQFKFWISINVITVVAILVIEYYHPELVPDVYEGPLSKTIDFGITYFVVILLTFFAISYIRMNYDTERELVMQKNMAIEDQKIQLEKLNSEKDKLFSIVTHDIRTPLISIQSYLELLTEVDLDELERRKIKKRLLEITRDTSSMLNNVLTWTKTQMEGAHVNLVPMNVADVLNDGLAIEKNISKKKGVNLEFVCEPNLTILADQNMLQLVARNLVNNAIKFTPNGGLVQVMAQKQGGKCVIRVVDNGLGIAQMQQEKLFQLNATSTYGTNKEKGIGLGLRLCKEFTDIQGGTIWFEPNPNQGSIFYLAFNLLNSEVEA